MSAERQRKEIDEVMARVVALYRYPVKGFTPEACSYLSILDSGRVAGDRVLGVRFADTEVPDDCWSRKTGMVVLVNTPGLARLQVQFDAREKRLHICVDGKVMVDESLDPEGRKRIAAEVENYLLTLAENPLAGHPERAPLRLVGDGMTPRYHDSELGQVTLHGRETLLSLEAALEGREISELRFRSNIAVEGLKPWEEQGWVGRKIRIGAVEFDVVKPKSRCLATHANPQTGQRDFPIMATLQRLFPADTPTFAVAMVPTNAPGEIHLGDEVLPLDGEKIR